VPERFWNVLASQEEADLDLVGFKSERYMGLVRNVRRLDWLLLYLFGASPAACSSFLDGSETDLDRLDDDTCFGRWATSLRMSDLGYQNSNQATLQVSANSLDEYVRDLSAAIATSNEDYARLGLRNDGEYLQLNSNQLQIENEYYSTIRPKRVARSGERPTNALRRDGVEYVELRALDVSPFDPAGIGQPQQKFLEAFLIYCLLLESPPVSTSEYDDIRRNHSDIARRGRQPDLMLVRNGVQLSMREWATQICAEMRPIFEMLDESGDGTYVQTLEQQLDAIRDSELTPSARLLAELQETGSSFADYGLQLARDYRDYFRNLAPEFNAQHAVFEAESLASHKRQSDIEVADKLSLDEYLARYYA
jgi:glutamate--cysteine ligase